MAWSWVVVSAQTGQKVSPSLQPVTDRAAPRISGVGTGSHSFLLRGGSMSRPQARNVFAKWKRVLVKCWNGEPKYAGFISDTSWSPKRGVLTVSTVEFRSILAKRFAFGIGTYAGGTLICANQTPRGIIWQLVDRGTRGDRSLVWNLPVVIPGLDEPGTLTREYENYKFFSIERAIKELQDLGPEIDFQPRWSAGGTLEWVLRVGSEATPLLGGPTVSLNMAAPQPKGFDFDVFDDGSEMVTGVFTLGEGAEAKRPHGEAATVAVVDGIPSMDVTRSRNDLSDQAALDAHAAAQVDQFKDELRFLKISMLASDAFAQGLQLGSPVQVITVADEWLDGGRASQRVIGITHTKKHRLELELDT